MKFVCNVEAGPVAEVMAMSGHNSHGPLPGAQIAGSIFRVQHCRLPEMALKLSSVTCRVQLPFKAAPVLPRKAMSCPSGRKVPANGEGFPTMDVGASSAKV